MGLIDYSTFSINKGKAYPFDFKINAVFASQEIGIKPAAKRFKISRNTLRTWIKKFKYGGKKNLKDQRKGPNHIPHKTCQKLEQTIIQIRKRAPCYGPLRIKYFFNPSCSLGAIQRIIKQNNLTRKKRKRYQKKRDLREVKAKLSSLTYLQMDLKHLRDIPNYWEQLKPLNLPKYQYTIRDVKSGMLFLGYSNELSELNARVMVDYVLSHLKPHAPFPLSSLTVQTDNGSEFSGNARRVETAPFVQMVTKTHGAKHRYIRPGHCNANADVESLHNIIEEEFYDLTRFTSRENFLKKAESYRLYFNLVRPSFSKQGRSPWLICNNDWKTTNLASFATLIETIDLDKIDYFTRGKSLPVLPELMLRRRNSDQMDLSSQKVIKNARHILFNMAVLFANFLGRNFSFAHLSLYCVT